MHFLRYTTVLVLAALAGLPFTKAHYQGKDMVRRTPHGFTSIPKFARGLAETLEFKSKTWPDVQTSADRSAEPIESIDVNEGQALPTRSSGPEYISSRSQNERRWLWKHGGHKGKLHHGHDGTKGCDCSGYPAIAGIPAAIVRRDPSPGLDSGKHDGCACDNSLHGLAAKVTKPVAKVKAVTASAADRPREEKRRLKVRQDPIGDDTGSAAGAFLPALISALTNGGDDATAPATVGDTGLSVPELLAALEAQFGDGGADGGDVGPDGINAAATNNAAIATNKSPDDETTTTTATENASSDDEDDQPTTAASGLNADPATSGIPGLAGGPGNDAGSDFNVTATGVDDPSASDIAGSDAGPDGEARSLAAAAGATHEGHSD